MGGEGFFKGAKVATDMFLSSGASTYYTVADVANIAKGSIDLVGGGITNSFNKSEDTMREMGEGAGEIINSAGMMAANMDMLLASASTYGIGHHLFSSKFKKPDVYDAKAILNNGKIGGVWSEMATGEHKGSWRNVANMENGKLNLASAAKYEAEGSPIAKVLSAGKKGSVVSGHMRELDGVGRFVKGHSAIRGFGPFVAAMLIGHAAKSVLGFAGGLIDESMKDYHRQKSVYYDNRFFNTQRDEMSNLQSLGAAMNNYESRYQSTARIYHSR